MARARNIKPGLFKNELLGAADPLLTILFCGLWTLADREGRLEDRPLRVRAEILPYRQVDIEPLLDWLQEHGFIRRYTAAGLPIIQIEKFTRHQNPHIREAKSTLPAYQAPVAPDHPGSAEHSAGTVPTTATAAPDTSAAALIPDSLNSDSLNSDSLNSDSLNTDSLNTDSLPFGPGASHGAPRAPVMNGNSHARADTRPPGRPGNGQATEPIAEPMNGATSTQPKSAGVWLAYSTAYEQRYGQQPVRNGRVNKHLCQLVDLLGSHEAPEVARYYLGHNNRWYVQRMHPVDTLVADAEKLRTEWATNRRMTTTEATQLDKTDARLSVFDRVNAELNGGSGS